MEDKKNPIVKVDWGELRRWRPHKYLIYSIIGIIVFFLASRSAVNYYDRMVEFWDAQIQVAEAARIEAEADQLQAEAEKMLVETESAEREAEAEQEINTLLGNITRLRRSVSTLREANTVLQEELVLAPEEIVSATDTELASSIPPKIDEVYPNFTGAVVVFVPEKEAFEGNRIFANAVRLSLEEVISLRFQTANQQGIINTQDEEIFSFQGIVTEKDVQITSWQDRLEASETLSELKSGTIIAFTDEKDAWEEKSRAQAKQLFWYRWGTRIGIGSVAVIGIVAASR